MIIAVPTGEGIVEEHVEFCGRFMLYTLASDYSIETVEEYEVETSADDGERTPADTANELARRGVTHLITMRIDNDTVHMYHARRVCVVRGAAGPIHDVVMAFAKGMLDDAPLPENKPEIGNFAKAV
ncbi:MAG: hypothetical protein NT080_02985 [Spirochaetes bacterium]|nr:hypothetical protein [Spirochaetota bacterium]